MNMEKKQREISLLVFFSLCILVGTMYLRYHNQDTLVIGVFSGSNWDVPGSDYDEIINRAIDKFHEKNPNIKVVFEEGIPVDDYSDWLAGEILKGTEPNVYLILPDDLSTLIQSGAVKSLNEEILKDKDFDPDIFYESAYNAGKKGSIQYALPFECNPKLMFVNKTLLKENGIQMPDHQWNWYEFYSCCSQISKGAKEKGLTDQYGYYGYSWMDAIYSNGATPFLDDGGESCFTEKNVVESIMFTKKMMEIHNDHMGNVNDFDLGKVAFRPLSFSEYRTYMPYPWRIKKFSQFEWNCIPMPAGPKGDNTSYMETLMLGMSSQTNNRQLAWEFMKILTSDEEIQKYIYVNSAGVSPVKSVTCSNEVMDILNQDTPGGSKIDMSLLDQVMKKAVNPNHFQGYSTVLQYADSHIKNNFDNGDELNLALFQLEEDLNKILK